MAWSGTMPSKGILRVGARSALGATSALAFWSLLAGPASAACVLSNQNVVCTGDPDLPVSYTDVVSVTFSDLTEALAPATGTPIAVILNQGDGAQDNWPGSEGMQGAISYDDDDYGFSTVGASGLSLVIAGGAGGNGTGSTNGVGAAGQSGGVGQSATVTVTAPTVSVSGDGFAAIHASTAGGTGGAGNYDVDSTGGASGQGGNAGTASVTADIGSLSIAGGATGIEVESLGGAGGSVGPNALTAGENNVNGSAGGGGGTGGAVNADLALSGVSLTNASGAVVTARSVGGAGGLGGAAASVDVTEGQIAIGGVGGAGGAGGTVTVTGDVTMSGTTSAGFVGVLAESTGGAGGGGGSVGGGSGSSGGKGGAGGAGGNVLVGSASDAFGLTATLTGDQSRALVAISHGGAGGEGGATTNSYGQNGQGGAAAQGGAAGDVEVYLSGTIAMSGDSSDAIYLQSIGGFDGQGTGFGSGDQSYGAGGDVTFVGTFAAGPSSFGISTDGYASDAIMAQSIGGGGGKALQATGLTALGASGLAGGDGGAVTLTVSGAPITTLGGFSRGIYADSVGGGGGNAGANTGVETLGGSGGSGGAGGSVSVNTSADIITVGDGSDGIFAASRGGGGGSAKSQSGLFEAGGQDGGGGGDGGSVSVNYLNSVRTSGDDADAISAQSVGGGGGDGATAVASGFIFVQAIGGQGGGGGDGGAVTVSQNGAVSGSVVTTGDRSRGVVAQSTGGGGGHGGSATAVDVILSGYQHGVGGSGGDGGAGGEVEIDIVAPVTTTGNLSDGVFAQSVGGGGGSAGGVIDAAVGAFVVQHGVGGTGGSGGNAAAVTVTTQGAVSTQGHHAAGVVAEAVGGGGGHSGLVINGSVVGATVGVAVGGRGGDGGSVDGKVSVTTGAVSTEGHSSAGILARSTGGGGGHGGTVITGDVANGVAFNVDVGGAGGDGGAGDDVEVTAGGPVSTIGNWSTAISAISTGGGGGSGGVVVDANAIDAGNVGVSIGGKGGAGATAGKVTVTSSGAVKTAGHISDGIYAASLGGYGGDAGIGLTSSSTVDAVTVGDIAIAIGGAGGAGGASDTVAVTSDGNIATAGMFSSGIVAQSIAGGGGRARGTVVGNIGDVGNISVAIGGAGGDGGNAGEVGVTTTTAGTTISTGGAFSHGILAQSIGGAGGAGGFAGEFSINVSAPATGGASGQVGVAVGGGGAAGGRSSKVTVQNASAIETADFGSFGILAQSIGGNGGDGGNVYAGNLTISQNASINVDVDVGGHGGYGAEGGDVEVDNSGAIATSGHFSTAIAAQAIGGDGGNGGSTYAVLAQIGPGSPGDVQVSIGGSGGGGGNAGTVTVGNQAALSTSGGASDGIFAQSVGGGGGRGGSAGYIGLNLTPPINIPNDSLPFNVNVNVGHGGTGGSGADGGAVSVTNAGTITTTGMRSRGIVAQSIGGGGGDGGTASATSFGLSDICNLGVEGKYICPSGDDENDVTVEVNSTVQVGGDGGTAGNGGEVTVVNTANITTSGQLSHGIYAQSVGGGGGNGGEGSLGIDAWTTNQLETNITDLPSNFLPSWSSYDIAVGGKASAGGDGGAVSVTNSGAILIQGPSPDYVDKYTGVQGGVSIVNPLTFQAGGAGIFAQSVGGGGGDGGAGSSSLTAIVTVGNGGGKGGKGGAVTVDNTGTITNTSGFSGTGIFAQSVGGGGGTAGDVGLGLSDSWEQLNIGAGVAVSGPGGDGGDGGDVTVTSKGAIRTTGVASSGIIAQSVGGSGGIAAIKSNASQTIYVGSGGDAGNGGDVSVTADASVTVTGEGSVGIAALSASGSTANDQAGAVTVNANANITASGKGGRGILVSSDSHENQADGVVTINIAQGATVSTGAEGAETVAILSAGAQSALTNLGTITSGNADSYAIRIETHDSFSIENYGVISGSILGSQTTTSESFADYSFDNYGTLNTGSVIDLAGVTSAFYSAGIISPGGLGTIQSTTISSNAWIELDQPNTYQVDFDPSQMVNPSVASSDMLILSSPAQVIVQGAVAPNVVLSNPGNAARSGSAYILQSDLTFDTSGLTIASTPTVQYSLAVSPTVQSGTNTLVLSYDADTTPWSGPGADLIPPGARRRVNANHDHFGNYVDQLVFGNGAPGSEDFVGKLGESVLNTKTFDELLDIYEGYVADEALAVPDATYLATLMFSDELFSCSRRDGNGMLVFGEQGECAWGRLYGNVVDVSQTKEGPSYTEAMVGLSIGAQFEMAPDTVLGVATAWEVGRLDLDGGEADVSRYFAGLSLKHDFGPLMLGGSLEAGFFNADIARSFFNGSETLTARGDTDGYHLAAHLRASHRFDMETLFLEPVMDVGVTWLRQDAFAETGAGDFGVSVSKLDQTIWSFNPHLNFGGTLTLGEMASQIEFRAGLLALAGGDPSVEAAFVGTGPDGPTFTIENNRSDLFADIGAGIETQLSDTLSLRGEFDSLIAEDQFAVGGRLRLNYSF